MTGYIFHFEWYGKLLPAERTTDVCVVAFDIHYQHLLAETASLFYHRYLMSMASF
ncbi:hypothetical protein D3C72_2100590 [compost metagenome]